MKTVLNIDAIEDGSIGLDKLSEDTQSQLEKINEIEGKQDKLISGNNIKTINGASILGEGDITISVNEEDLTEILDRVSENEKVTAHALNELRENLNNIDIDIPVATTDTIGGVKLGTELASYSNRVCLAGDNVGNVGININNLDLSVTGEEKLGLRKSYFKSHDRNQEYRIAPLSFGSIVGGEWYATSLGVPVDSDYFTLNEQGLTIKEGSISDIKVTWDANSDMNDFKTPGIYEIYGERTVKTDNLPITNDGSGHSFAAKLTVIASTLQPANNEICITQFLQLSNRVGGEGTTYVRTYNENNNSINGWSAWQKQMGMKEYGIVTDTEAWYPTERPNEVPSGPGMYYFIDNGMYSGIYVDEEYISGQAPSFLETFVLVVINDYAVSGQAGLPRHITQLKYAVDAITGQSTVKKRVGTGNDAISWSDWEDIGGNAGTVCIDDYVWDERLQRTGLYGLLTNDLTKDLIKPNVTYELRLGTGDITGPTMTGEIYPENDIPMLDPDNKIAKHIINTQIDIDGYRSVGKCYIKYYKPKSQIISEATGQLTDLANPTVEIDYYGSDSNHNIYTFNPETFKEVYVNGNIKLDSDGREILDPINNGGNSSNNGGAYGLVEHDTSDTTVSLTPNTFHVWGEVTELTLTFEEETAGVANEFLFQFTSGAAATTLTLPDNIKWANDSAPTIAPNKIYQVSILNGLASVLEFNNVKVFPVISYTNGSGNEEYAKVYEYFVNTYNLTSTSSSPSNGVLITETLVCSDVNYGGVVLKVSLNHNAMLLLWTENAINDIMVPSITNLGKCSNYCWD